MKKIYSLIQFCLVAMVIFSSATTSLNAQCMDGTTEVTVTMTNETFDGENSWILWDATAGMTIAGVNSNPAGAGATACANTTATGMWTDNTSVSACATDGNVIELYTYESFGDGWQNGNLFVETTEDATGYVATNCSPQNFELYNGGSSASDNDLTAGTADGGINCDAVGAGVLVASFSTVCIAGCDITCPDDIVAENDAGVCMANVVLPPPTFDPMGCTIEQQADFETATTGDVDLTFVALTYAGDAITVPAGPTPASCVTEVPFTICWNTDNGGSAAGFESAEITFPAPLINPAVVANLNGQFPANGTTFPAGASGTDIAQGGPLPAATGMPVGNGDCTAACMDIVVSLADYANWNGGTFTIGADGGVNLFCAANTISISTTVATSCASFVVTGVPGFEPGSSPASLAAGADFPLGTTTVCYTATGSANGASFPISCKFDVSVIDTEAPVITCPGDFTFNLQGGECCQIYEFEVSATDNCFMGDGFSTLTGPFCDPCADPSQGSALACGGGPNSIIQLIDNVFPGDSLTEVCFNQETFNTTTAGVLNVYCYDGVNIPFDDGAGTFVPLASADLTLNDINSGSCVCTPFESVVVPAGCTTIAIEVFNAVGRSVQTPASCDGAMATGMNTYLRAPLCGSATPVLFNTIGFSLDAGFNATFRSAELLSIDNTATPGNPGFDTFNEFESGDELPIGIHCFAYVATDRAGNVSNCDFCITVNGVPESQIVNSLTCNNSVNLSLDENCQAFISADMFLEGGPYGCYFDCYEVYITDEFGNNVVSGCGDAATKVPGGDPVFPNTDVNDVNGCVIDIPCGEYTVMVYDRCNDNTCWGNLVVEDKIAPIVIAPIDITLNCLMDTEPGDNTVEGVEALSLVDEAFTFSDATTGLVYTSTQTLVPPVSGAVITDINVDVDFSHSWVNDLDIVLTGPNGATVFLTDSDCGTQDNILATFDEESGTAIGGCSASFGTAPHEDCTIEQTNFTLNGSFETASFSNNGLGLDQWYGLPVSGDWTLQVFDNTGGDGGCLKGLNMNFAYSAFTTGMPVIENGCGDETVTFQDEVFDNDCDGTIIVRTWTATDEKGNSGTAQNTILVEQIGLDAENIQWFYPEETIDLTCDACVTPECIYDFSRAQWIADNPPASPEVADSDTYIASANAAGVRNAYPFFLNREGLQERFDINNCNLFFSFSDLVLPTCGADCSGNSKIIRTWTVLDWCSGETSESVQVINAKDTEGPTIDLVESITVSASIHDCSANFILPTPEHLLDNCSSVVTYTVYGAPGTITDESASPFFSNGEWRVVGLPKTMEPAIYTYAAEDCCGNVTLATLEVNVVDGTPPIAIGTQNIVINLTSSPTDPDGGLAKLFKESVDNGSHDGGCGPVRLAIRRTDAVTQTAARGGNINDCGSLGEIYNNAGDVWNNNSTFFNFNDIAPNQNQPTDHSLYDTDNGDFVKFCCNDLASPNALTDANGMTYVIIEVELGVWDDANMDGIPGTPGDQFARTWVNVRVESKLEATIICPPLVKITCEMDETDLSITGTATGNATCGGLNTTYMDLCGLDINQDMEIDEFEGTGTINEVGMCYDVNGDGVIANYDGDGEDVGEDFFNKACHYGPITRYWTVEGTDIKCRQIIIIEEPAGVFAGNGLDLNDDGDCNDPGEICPVIDWPYSRNDFANLAVNDGAQSDCNGDGTRDAVSSNDITLVASDGRGYADYAEVALDCIDALCEEPVWVDANCSLVGWSLDSDTFFFEGDACLKIINTYTVIDWCQYNPNSLDPQGIWTWTVVGKLVDPFPPVVTAGNGMFPAIPGGTGSVNPTSGACVGFATASAVAFDTSIDDDGEVIDNACPSQWLKWNVYVDIGADWVFDREWSSFVQEDLNNASDPLWSEDNAADNIAAYGYTIPDVRVGNRGGVDNATDFATEPNFEYTINIPDAIPADCGETQHRVVWKVYDGCGNVSSTTSFFTVSDMKAPTPYCVNLSTALMADPDGAGPEESMVELWAIDFDFGSFDNCTDPEELRFTFTDTPPSDDPDYIEDRRSSARAFTCDDLAGTTNAVLTVPVYVWDGCNNFDFCLVNLRLIDNNPDGCTDSTGTGSIAGTIVTEFGETVENVEVTNEDMMDLYEENKMTDDNGDYAFDFALMSHDFEVSATKNDDYLNGVSTLDLVIIQRHILGSAQLDSPYKMIAADVNNDKAITAIDLIQLRKLILGIYDELPNNSSWRFADASTTIDATNPWNTIDETINIYNLTTDMMDENFVGIKVGDVNQSVVANLSSTSTESRSAASIDVLFEDRAVEVGELVEITITGESINDLYGYQFTLETEGLELVEVGSGLIEVTNANFGALGNKVTTSWNTLSPISANGDLFTMTFKSNVSGQLSEILDLNSSVTRAEAYVGDNLEILNIDLRNGGGDVNYALYQNEPNPFSDKTIVGFDIPEAGAATLTVLDVTGKVLRVINGDYAKGYNELELSKSDFGSAGVYYYQLDSGDFTATKKMIIIE